MGRTPELLIVFLGMGVFWLVPIAAAVWALVTLRRLAHGQQAISAKLDNIERSLQGSRIR